MLFPEFSYTSNRALKVYNEGVTAYDYLDLSKAETLFKDSNFN